MTDADEITRYQDEAADDFNVTLRVEPTVDGRFEALALPMLGKPPSSTTAQPICTRPTAVESARGAIEILRRGASA